MLQQQTPQTFFFFIVLFCEYLLFKWWLVILFLFKFYLQILANNTSKHQTKPAYKSMTRDDVFYATVVRYRVARFHNDQTFQTTYIVVCLHTSLSGGAPTDL